MTKSLFSSVTFVKDTAIQEHRIDADYSDDDGRHRSVLKFWEARSPWDGGKGYDAKAFFDSLVSETRPICALYCVTPCAVNTDHVRRFCDACRARDVFFALVFTNKFACETHISRITSRS